jgi:hypothetical protein
MVRMQIVMRDVPVEVEMVGACICFCRILGEGVKNGLMTFDTVRYARCASRS